MDNINQGTISAIGIITRDRDEDLIASLRSYVENCRRHGRSPEFIVVDDSRTERSCALTRAALESFQAEARASVGVRYAGLSEKRRFAEALVRESSVARDLVDWAIMGDERCRVSTGANRNSLLLDTLGSLVFSADDDTRGVTAAAPDCQETVVLSTAHDPTDFWFFDDRRAALDAVLEVDVDLLGCHERYLGRRLSTYASTSEPASGVTLTLSGLVGESGMGSPRHFLTLSGSSRARLLSSESAYRSALRSREVLRTVSRPTIAATAFCMTGFFGFDNRRLLPPFFPATRNADGIFGLAVHRYVDGSRVAFLPWIQPHVPSERRSFEGHEAWTDAQSVQMADVLIAAILSHDGGAGGTDGEKLRGLGKYLSEIASLSPQDFEMFVGAARQLHNVTATVALETRLREYGSAPGYWAEDVRKAIGALRSTGMQRDYMVPRDLLDGRDVERSRALAQELVAKFGALLDAWPRLVEAARRLHSAERRISEALR